MDRILLVGAECIENGGAAMKQAAQEMHRAANQMENVVYKMDSMLNNFVDIGLQNFIEDLKKQIDRLEIIKEEKEK